MNCIENLPVYGAIVVCATAVGAKGNFLDSLALALIAARVCQTVVHIAFAQTDLVVSVRFTAACHNAKVVHVFEPEVLRKSLGYESKLRATLNLR